MCDFAGIKMLVLEVVVVGLSSSSSNSTSSSNSSRYSRNSSRRVLGQNGSGQNGMDKMVRTNGRNKTEPIKSSINLSILLPLTI